ncbi:MAG: phosphotransferase [Acidimicrobiales bacterium]
MAGHSAFRPIVTTTPGLYQTIGRRRCLALAQERWHDWFGPDEVAQVHAAIDRFPDDVASINRPVTLIHGDPRSDNILYRDDDHVVLLDWALVANAHPAFDIGYLLSSCLLPENAGAKRRLVDHYAGVLAALGVDADPADLHATVDATYRSLVVQQLMSIAVLHGDDYAGQKIFDLWMPRLLAGLAAPGG